MLGEMKFTMVDECDDECERCLFGIAKAFESMVASSFYVEEL